MEFLKSAWSILTDYYPMLLRGVGYTMLIALTGTVLGLVIGLLTGIVRTTPLSKKTPLRILQRVINAIITAYVEVFRFEHFYH